MLRGPKTPNSMNYCYITWTKNTKLNELLLYYVDQKRQTQTPTFLFFLVLLSFFFAFFLSLAQVSQLFPLAQLFPLPLEQLRLLPMINVTDSPAESSTTLSE